MQQDKSSREVDIVNVIGATQLLTVNTACRKRHVCNPADVERALLELFESGAWLDQRR